MPADVLIGYLKIDRYRVTTIRELKIFIKLNAVEIRISALRI